VGAVLVKGGRVVGEGHHRGPGRPHAEVEALKAAGSRARGAVLYVTLEPCVHTDKRTPPCAPEVIRARPARVVVGMADPNPQVAGGGIRALKAAGVPTDTGCLEAECRYLNAPYVRAVTLGLPWVTLKVAQTLDGKVATATGASRWITGEAARRHGHGLRARSDAVLVGIGTVRADDPELTVRLVRGRNPVRVVVDARLETPAHARVLTGPARAPTILSALAGADPARRERLERAGTRVLTVPGQSGRDGRVDLRAVLTALAAEGRHRVLCEGGPELAAALVREGLVNRVAFYLAPRILGGDDARGSVGGTAPPSLEGALALGPMRVRRLGPDLLIEADVPDGDGAEPGRAGKAK